MVRYKSNEIKPEYRSEGEDAVCLLIERTTGDYLFLHPSLRDLTLILKSLDRQGRSPDRIYEGLKKEISTAVAEDYYRLLEGKQPRTFRNLNLGDFLGSGDEALLMVDS